MKAMYQAMIVLNKLELSGGRPTLPMEVSSRSVPAPPKAAPGTLATAETGSASWPPPVSPQ